MWFFNKPLITIPKASAITTKNHVLIRNLNLNFIRIKISAIAITKAMAIEMSPVLASTSGGSIPNGSGFSFMPVSGFI